MTELIVSSSTVFPEREEEDPGWFSPSATDLFPERKAKDPGWFQAKELELAGLVAVRNAAFERY